MHHTILVVDDQPENIDVLSEGLRGQYRVKVAISGPDALEIAKSERGAPDLILLDIMMPGMDGYEVCRQLKADPLTSRIPVIFVTAKSEMEDEQGGLDMGAVDFIGKPVNMPIVLARVRTHLALYDQKCELEIMVRERTKELNESRLEIVRRLGIAAEFRDNETALHITRIGCYSKIIASAIEVSDDWVELISNTAPMHDIGKIGIPDHILLKPGKLSDEEWEIMKRHSEHGAEIIGDHPSDLLRIAREIALTHHEKWDGSGYPQGLAGKDIPLSGRIVAITDVFDALTSERPYKAAWPVDDAVDLIRESAGSHFDPELVEVFFKVLPEILEVRESYADDSGENINKIDSYPPPD